MKKLPIEPSHLSSRSTEETVTKKKEANTEIEQYFTATYLWTKPRRNVLPENMAETKLGNRSIHSAGNCLREEVCLAYPDLTVSSQSILIDHSLIVRTELASTISFWTKAAFGECKYKSARLT